MTASDECREALLPCPFCGKQKTPLVWLGCDDVDFDGSNPDCWHVICDASSILGSGPGGCGASSGYKESKVEAIAQWNRRAPAPVQAESEVVATRVMQSAHALCPTDMPHTARMKWMADYFLSNYAPAPQGKGEQGEAIRSAPSDSHWRQAVDEVINELEDGCELALGRAIEVGDEIKRRAKELADGEG